MDELNIAAVQKLITNQIDPALLCKNQIAGIVGDGPSLYSKSPRLWNAAFRHLGIDAVYLPFDVPDRAVGDLVSALKKSERFLGVNVTVPHKIRIIDYLDELDSAAQCIGAVNTVVRTAAGKLIGYNTDGAGFVESLLTPQPGERESFVQELSGKRVLLLGAGGSARSVAFRLAELVASGQLLICNRSAEHGQALAAEIEKAGYRATAIHEDQAPVWAPRCALIINSTTKGQAGLRILGDGKMTSLEPYSALAPARPPAVLSNGSSDEQAETEWRLTAEADIASNQQSSLRLAQSIPKDVSFYDLIYQPEETVFLRHGRLTGHRTMNGKAMIISQAVIAFCSHICRAHLSAMGRDNPDTRRSVRDVMYASWQ
jgi:shikimate dehydrogenase